jgi:Ca-activated chloride channel homolog
MTLTRYWPLLFLLLIPYVSWAASGSLTDSTRSHLRLSTIVRALIVFLLATALTEPVLHRPADSLSVIYLLDISRSISPPAIDASIEWIQKVVDTGRPAQTRFIPFARNSAVFDDLEALKNVDVNVLDQGSTNIRDAVEHAMQSFPAHTLKRLVLISDGNETAGYVSELGRLLKKEHIRVYTVVENARSNGDSWIDSIVAPARVDAGESFPVDVRIYSQSEKAADIEIRNGGKTLGSRAVHLDEGLNRVSFETRLTGANGPVTIEAEIKSTGDAFPENNTFRESIVVQGRPRVLYVDSRAESTKYLQKALTMEGLTVDVLPAARVPTTVSAFDAYDAVILSDIAGSNLTDAQMTSLSIYVRDLGGGFILSGGENNYGEGGYFNTAIEKILPVSFEMKEDKTVAMIVVLDKSGSMGGLKMDLAKEATKAPVALMKDRDLFGVVAFDNEFYWPVTLQPAANRDAILRSISTIAAGGDTDMYPPLLEAYTKLSAADADLKHIILLSDGISVPGEFMPLVSKMAAEKITVSTVAVSMGSDRQLLKQIAEWGKGRLYYTDDARRVPQLFTDEAELATGKTLKENPFTPTVKKDVEAFTGIDFKSAPPLLGYVATKPKETAEILLEHKQDDRDDPILARWQYGLGKTVVFTSDLKDRWATNWLRWNGYGKFWSQLVRETMRRHEDGAFNLQVTRVDDRAKITINAAGKDGESINNLSPEVRIVTPDQSTSTIEANQVAPGTYEATVRLTQQGPYLFRTFENRTAGPAQTLPYSYPDEYHFHPPNISILQALSEETGGTFQPAPADIFNTSRERIDIPEPIWPYPTGLALLLCIVDVFLRRVRVGELAGNDANGAGTFRPNSRN